MRVVLIAALGLKIRSRKNFGTLMGSSLRGTEDPSIGLDLRLLLRASVGQHLGGECLGGYVARRLQHHALVLGDSTFERSLAQPVIRLQQAAVEEWKM